MKFSSLIDFKRKTNRLEIQKKFSGGYNTCSDEKRIIYSIYVASNRCVNNSMDYVWKIFHENINFKDWLDGEKIFFAMRFIGNSFFFWLERHHINVRLDFLWLPLVDISKDSFCSSSSKKKKTTSVCMHVCSVVL